MSIKSKDLAHEKLKRFDDVFRMILLIITISITFSQASTEISLEPTLIWVFFALLFWIFGHIGGFYPDVKSPEIYLKLIGWFFLSLVSITVLSKLTLSTSILVENFSIFLLLCSYFLTLLPYAYFRKNLDEIERRRFMKSLSTIVAFIALGLVLNNWNL